MLDTSAWYLKTIGLQLVAETFAVSLFRMLAESSKDAVLCQICRRIVAYRPGSLSEVLTEHYRRAHPEALGIPSQ